VNTTAFITRCLKKVWPDGTARLLRHLLLCVGLSVFWVAGSGIVLAAEITQLRVERSDDGLYLSAIANFELSPVVEDALMKGIPLFFVVEADIYRERWYWTDPRVASAARTIRLAYQPLTRRWRVNIASGLISSSAGLRATLNQNYETLAEAVSAIQRVARWKIAENSEVLVDPSYRLEFNFRLDLSQLPRPFQIGMAGQSEWNISAQVKERLRVEPAAAAPRTVEGAK
jgi:Domain of unknown function (DUF4390)